MTLTITITSKTCFILLHISIPCIFTDARVKNCGSETTMSVFCQSNNILASPPPMFKKCQIHVNEKHRIAPGNNSKWQRMVAFSREEFERGRLFRGHYWMNSAHVIRLNKDFQILTCLALSHPLDTQEEPPRRVPIKDNSMRRVWF